MCFMESANKSTNPKVDICIPSPNNIFYAVDRE